MEIKEFKMNFKTLTVATEGSVMTVTLENGDINLMSATMAEELFKLVGALAINPDIKVVVFESANADFFIAHFDVSDIFKSLSGDESVPQSKFAEINIVQSLNLSIQALPQVTIAKVDGVCRGGGFEFTLAMDMTFATEKARFCFPEASAGFLPSGGGATLLSLKIGKNRALEVMLSGRDFSGSEASQYGFINNSFADTAALNSYVADLTLSISRTNAPAISAVNSTIKQTYAGFTDAIMAGFAQENATMVSCLAEPSVHANLKSLHEASKYETEIDLPATIRGWNNS